MVDPHVLLAFLWDSVKLEIDPEILHTYWREAKIRGLPWAQGYDGQHARIPLRLFGDDAAVGRKSGEKLYAIFLSCPLFRPKCARQSRWLLWCMRSSLYVGFQSLRPILARLTWSLNKAFNEVCNETGVMFQVTEIAADWKFMRDFFCLTTHWNAGAAGRFCHFCKSKRADMLDLADVCWRSHVEFINEVCGQDSSPLLLLECFHPTVLQWCELHNCNLGLLWTCNLDCRQVTLFGVRIPFRYVGLVI